jgi:NADH pyrophosphatase NudC (nudix superfamily)
LGLALVLVVLLFLTRPFFQPVDEDFETEEQIESLLAQKEALLQDLRSLDSDMEAGKVAPELYAHDRPLLMKRAALTLQQLDRLGYSEAPLGEVEAAPATVAQASVVVGMSVDDQIEAAVRKLRTPAEVDADIEAAVRRMREQATPVTSTAVPVAPRPAVTTATRYCPQCGTPVDPDDRFCATCGTNLIVEPQATQSA